MSFIFFLSSKSTLPSPINLPSIDKFYHFIEYFILGILLSLIDLSKIFLFFIGIIYAFLDEVHQSFVLGRDASFFDWLFDSFGILAGILGVWLWKKRKY